MHDTIRLEAFASEFAPTWCAIPPMMPANCDLKSHLGELRTISDVLAKREAGEATIGPVSED